MSLRSPLGRVALVCHAALTVLLAIATLSGRPTPLRVGVAVAALAPLLVTLLALLTRRRGTERWLALLLVPYAGALSGEVVARLGAAPLLNAALLLTVLELGLLLAVIRASRPPGARE